MSSVNRGAFGSPGRVGLYHPGHERDGCGVGFVARMDGIPSHEMVRQGLEILRNLEHRGATGADACVGDGAGILLQLPVEFLAKECGRLGIELPQRGCWGVGMIFLPVDGGAETCKGLVETCAVLEGLRVLGWREVPLGDAGLGRAARETQPRIEQVFIGVGEGWQPKGEQEEEGFERVLYLLRRQIENRAEKEGLQLHIPSFSGRTLVYKGMLTSQQLKPFYADLSRPELLSAVALVHARYSTNTFPSWPLSQPFRLLAHNGEINTLRGNINWMRAREKIMRSEWWKHDLKRLYPIVNSQDSDSAVLDAAMEFLLHNGRSLEHCMTMMIPEAWENHPQISQQLKDYYQYHATLMEPWDGPAAVAFCNGRSVGAVLDRNGLRPMRITLTYDGRLIAASETGVLPLEAENIKQCTRLRPGEIIMLDLTNKQISNEASHSPLRFDAQVKQQLASACDYGSWVKKHIHSVSELSAAAASLRRQRSDQVTARGLPPAELSAAQLLCLQQTFGYTKEDFKFILIPMATSAQEPIGSMGHDTPIAVLSNRPRLLFEYFRQNFAQVTNPAIDPIRERMVMSLATYIGNESNLLSVDGSSAKASSGKPSHEQLPEGDTDVLRFERPLLSDEELEKLLGQSEQGFRCEILSSCFAVAEAEEGFKSSLNRLCHQAEQAVSAGVRVLVLSDIGVDKEHAPLPSLLAISAVHHHLIGKGARGGVGLVSQTAEAREVQHMATLVGYGASAVHPWLVWKTLENLHQRQPQPKESLEAWQNNYADAIDKGLLKVFSKMGISTLLSYQGAQIYECLGLDKALVERHFCGTPSPIGGIDLDGLYQEIIKRHQSAFISTGNPFLDLGGIYQYRRDGEYHAINSSTAHNLQLAVRQEDPQAYQRFCKLVHQKEHHLGTLRALFDFKPNPIPIAEVEPVADIVRRFCSGAMSLGSISRECHEDLAIAMNRLGGKSNTGEGGEDPTRFTPDANGDSRSSYIKQVASGRFGVSSYYLVNARELQIKIAQGAKPGEGGQLPGYKVDDYIGKMRFTTPGVGLISPPPHHDIYSIEDIKQLIFDLKNANPQADVSVKLVAETGVGAVAAGVAKAKADAILISGHEGGTGASPLSSIRYAGIPWEIGLAETQQTLVLNHLRQSIRVQTDGQLKTGRDVVVAALLGAEEFGFSTLPLITLGCIMMRVCHLNTCPVGVATQDPRLRKKYQGKPEYLIRYFQFVAQDVRSWMAHLGFPTMDEMIGQSHVLQFTPALKHWKAKGVDLSPILQPIPVSKNTPRRNTRKQQHGLDTILDNQLIQLAQPALKERKPVQHTLQIRNTNLTIGTMLGSEVSKTFGADGLPDNTIQFRLHGSAGQSFGAFLPKGITLHLHGESNDYIAKGLSGGHIVVQPPAGVRFQPQDNMIIGNVALYGATAGKAYFNGQAGERFCVRNSGAEAVVEGVGDHGCEYMTGGRVLILGPTGLNFAAGMSGGIAYILDENGSFPQRCNTSMVELEQPEGEDMRWIQQMLQQHIQITQSPKAQQLLQDWQHTQQLLVKIMPTDYKRILQQRQQAAAP